MAYAGRYSASRPSDETYLAYLEGLVNLTQWLLARNYDVRLLIGDAADRNATQEFRSSRRESGYQRVRKSVLSMNRLTPLMIYSHRSSQQT